MMKQRLVLGAPLVLATLASFWVAGCGGDDDDGGGGAGTTNVSGAGGGLGGFPTAGTAGTITTAGSGGTTTTAGTGGTTTTAGTGGQAAGGASGASGAGGAGGTAAGAGGTGGTTAGAGGTAAGAGGTSAGTGGTAAGAGGTAAGTGGTSAGTGGTAAGAGGTTAGAGGTAAGAGGTAAGAGGTAAGAGGTAGGGGGPTCVTKASVANAVFTDFEYLTTAPGAQFTHASGYAGGFYGDTGFAVTADAHGGTHALTISGTGGFTQIGGYNSACLDLSNFTALTFWAKGSGTISVNIPNVGNVNLGALGATYAQYTVTFAALNFNPPVIGGTPDRQIQYQVGGVAAPTLFLDDIAFVP